MSVTFIVNKPLGWTDGLEASAPTRASKGPQPLRRLLSAEHRSPHDASGVRLLKSHFSKLEAIEAEANKTTITRQYLDNLYLANNVRTIVDVDRVNVDDLLVSSAVTGTAASWLKPSLLANGFDPAHMPDAPGRQYDSNQSFAGKKWMDVWAAGQGLGTIRAISPVAEVVDELCREYEQACSRLQGLRTTSRKVIA
jgi:hypothetical protein